MVQTRLTEKYRQTRTPTSSLKRSPSTKRKLGKSTVGLELDYVPPKVDEGTLESFRKALDTSSPDYLPGREEQIEEVKEFVMSHLLERKGGSLYISGAPGTGKTAVVRYVIEEIIRERERAEPTSRRKKLGFYHMFINCMCKSSASDFYNLILEKLPKTKGSSQKFGSPRDRLQDRIFVKGGSANMIVIVLDEMDQILKGTNEVLYSLFEWARSPNAKLILIGIANALDLTVRHLPFLHLNASPVKQERGLDGKPIEIQSMCQTMSFPPYSRDNIEKIIQERMEQVGQNIFDASAIKFVAAKVAASTGDARKALHACKEAMVTVEKQEQRSVLKSTDENVPDSSIASPAQSLSPKKVCIRNDQIGILAVSKALQVKKDDGPLPLQQTTILAALLKINQDAPGTRDPLLDGVNKPIPMPTLYKQYRKICSLKGFSWIEESEIQLVCEVLQDRSLVSVVNSGGSSTVKKLSFGSKRFGSPSASKGNKIGVLFDPRAVEGLVMKGDMKTLFGQNE